RRTTAPVVKTTSTERVSGSTDDGAMGSRRVCIGSDAGAGMMMSGMTLLLLVGFGLRPQSVSGSVLAVGSTVCALPVLVTRRGSSSLALVVAISSSTASGL